MLEDAWTYILSAIALAVGGMLGTFGGMVISSIRSKAVGMGQDALGQTLPRRRGKKECPDCRRLLDIIERSYRDDD